MFHYQESKQKNCANVCIKKYFPECQSTPFTWRNFNIAAPHCAKAEAKHEMFTDDVINAHPPTYSCYNLKHDSNIADIVFFITKKIIQSRNNSTSWHHRGLQIITTLKGDVFAVSKGPVTKISHPSWP
jgi:hypothetical protein